jgi:hypothetical protein
MSTAAAAAAAAVAAAAAAAEGGGATVSSIIPADGCGSERSCSSTVAAVHSQQHPLAV